MQVVNEYEFPIQINQSKSKGNLNPPSASSCKTHINNNCRHAPVLLEDVNNAAFDFFSKTKSSETEKDTDLCFFKSLLPDMKLMTPDQKRCYKIQMMNLAGSILNESAVYNHHRTCSIIPRESVDYRQIRDKRPHSNSSTKIFSSTSSLNMHADTSPYSGASLNDS